MVEKIRGVTRIFPQGFKIFQTHDKEKKHEKKSYRRILRYQIRKIWIYRKQRNLPSLSRRWRRKGPMLQLRWYWVGATLKFILYM